MWPALGSNAMMCISATHIYKPVVYSLVNQCCENFNAKEVGPLRGCEGSHGGSTETEKKTNFYIDNFSTQ